MSYHDFYSAEDLDEYEIIEDWSTFFKPLVKRDPKGRIIPMFIDKKIFNIDKEPQFNSDYNDFTFSNCYFAQGVGFRDANFKGKFTFINCNIEGAIHTIGTSTFEQGIYILNTYVNKISITKGDFDSSNWTLKGVDELLISGGTFRKLDVLLNGKAFHIKIDCNRINGDLFIDGSGKVVENLNISGTARDVSMFFYGMEVKNLIIGLFVNEKQLKLSNIQSSNSQGKILITNSQLGKAEFSSIDLSKFHLIVLDEVNLVDCIFNNIAWSKNLYGAPPLKLLPEANITNKQYSLKSRETFRQLKYAMSKQGDVINEQKFHSLEMGMYFETLSWKRDFWTKWIIFLSFLTSDFGQSFWRPLFFIFLFHTILFIPLLYSDIPFEFKISLTGHSWGAFWKGANSYLFLMNPFRKIDESMFKGGWIIVDILMRISSSYMIYNMIRATRRFIK